MATRELPDAVVYGSIPYIPELFGRVISAHSETRHSGAFRSPGRTCLLHPRTVPMFVTHVATQPQESDRRPVAG